MKRRSTFQNVIGLIVAGTGLIALGVAAMALITMRQSQQTRRSSVVPAAVKYPAPKLVLNDLDGNPHALSDYIGQVVLVNMWASWCPPCVEELPTLNDFHEDHVKDGFLIIGINDGEEPPVVKDYVVRTGLVFPIWIDTTWLAESAFNTMNLPSSFLIDRAGQVRLQWVGAISREMLDRYVVPIIKE